MPRKLVRLDKLYSVKGANLNADRSMNGPECFFGGSRRSTVYVRISALNKTAVRKGKVWAYNELEPKQNDLNEAEDPHRPLKPAR